MKSTEFTALFFAALLPLACENNPQRDTAAAAAVNAEEAEKSAAAHEKSAAPTAHEQEKAGNPHAVEAPAATGSSDTAGDKADKKAPEGGCGAGGCAPGKCGN